jgi:hypothetical protein
MKSERRHELETNSLALWLRWRAPQLLEKYGTKVLLGVVIVTLAVVLIRYRINAPRQAAENAADYLNLADEYVQGLERMQRTPGDAAQVTRLIADAIDASDDAVLQARAHVMLGDYYWALANYPEFPEAATQPALRPELPRHELLRKAADAYALAAPDGERNGQGGDKAAAPDRLPASEQGYLEARALLALAAVAEARARDFEGETDPQATGHWEAARERYEQVLKLPNTPAVLKDEAQWRLDELARIQQPIWIVAATQPTTAEAPETMTTTTLPSTQLTIPPIIMPTTPTTLPSTRPTTQPAL